MKLKVLTCVLGVLSAQAIFPLQAEQNSAINFGEGEISLTSYEDATALVVNDLSSATEVDLSGVLNLQQELSESANNSGIGVTGGEFSGITVANVGESQCETNTDLLGTVQNAGNVVEWQGVANRIHNLQEVKKLYADMGCRYLWSKNGRVSELAATLIQSIANSWQHALNPDYYHFNTVSSLLAGDTIYGVEQFEIILSDAFITLKKHLANGVVDPKQQFEFWNQQPERLNFAMLYQQAQANGNVASVLRIDNADYQRLLNEYVALKGVGDDKQPSVPRIVAKKLQLGSKGPEVVKLRKILGLNANSDVFDKKVRKAVVQFQKRNGLSADGVAGKRTIAVLNGDKKSTAYRLEKLALNMERLRWQDKVPTDTYVWINIPAYKMMVRRGNEYLFETNTIVGRTKRPTPIFKDQLEFVVLAPYWNVPSTIFKEDKLPKNNSGGYRLRQTPSGRNALGNMKFLFPNRHAIYMHDTPNRRLFKRSRRALSSGCIRLERAEDFAVFLLEDRGYDRNGVRAEIKKAKEKWITLEGEKRYPVYINYFTAWVDSTGRVKYSGDIYKFDNNLSKLLKSALK